LFSVTPDPDRIRKSFPAPAHPQFSLKPGPGGQGDSFGLQVPPLAGLSRAGGLQPRFLGSASILPPFAEAHPMPPGEFFPAGIPHPSLSPPGNAGERKLGWASFPGCLDF